MICFFSKSPTVKKEHLKYFCCNYFVPVILFLVQQCFLSSAAECCSKHLSSWTYNPVTIPRFQILACIIYLPLICSFQLNVVLASKSLWKMPFLKNLSSKLDLFPMCPCVSALCFQFRLDSFSWLDYIERKLLNLWLSWGFPPFHQLLYMVPSYLMSLLWSVQVLNLRWSG